MKQIESYNSHLLVVLGFKKVNFATQTSQNLTQNAKLGLWIITPPQKKTSNLCATWSLVCSILCIVLLIIIPYAFALGFSAGKGGNPFLGKVAYAILVIGGLGSVMSLIAGVVLAIIGLIKSKQLNGKGRAMSIVALSLIATPIIFVGFLSLVGFWGGG
ncbi:MAG: hypothetical protein OXF30_02210 [Candidatus Saccharibacteria bacterium]|nr:hypothetical protein [Candidatus Saccharibacteria bacterium]